MRRRRLGRSDLEVSEIGLGSWLTYGGGVGRAQAEACLAQAFELGINFIDTANVYSGGAAEAFLGEALRGRPRSSYVLATKVYFPMPDGSRGLSAAQIERQLDGSLRRLGVDHVDLYQCHRFDPEVPLPETMAALGRAVEQGKVRWLGFSEWTLDQLRAAHALPGARFVSSQPQYSLLARDWEGIFPALAAEGIGQVVWSPLAQGILTGKYRGGAPPPEGSRAASQRMGTFIQGRLTEATLARVERLRPVAAELGLTMAQLALAWVLRRPEVSSAIVGATSPAQLVENARASGVVLDGASLARIEEALRPA
jgi:aryl-alcohol dehydrogenase-like predicted oxidoreductase